MHQLAERLRAERERQRRTLRDLSAETKIREPFLAAIERGDFDVLPQVYVRSFVKTYAAALGVPEAQVTSMLTDALARDIHDDAPTPARKRSAPASGSGTRSSTVASPAESTKRQTDNRWRPLEQKLGTSIPDMLRNLPIWIWIAVSLLLVAVVIALVVSTSDEVETTTGESTVVNVEAAAAVQDSMVLRAEVVDTAWISLTADGTSSYQAVLLPGTSARWSAMERFEYSMGNAGGVVFYRDDVRLPAFAGPKQSVRKVVVTRTNVTTPSTAWQEQPATAPTAAKKVDSVSRATPQQPRGTRARSSTTDTKQTPVITPVKPR